MYFKNLPIIQYKKKNIFREMMWSLAFNSHRDILIGQTRKSPSINLML